MISRRKISLPAMFPLSCARVRAHTTLEASAHKNLGCAHKKRSSLLLRFSLFNISEIYQTVLHCINETEWGINLNIIVFVNWDHTYKSPYTSPSLIFPLWFFIISALSSPFTYIHFIYSAQTTLVYSLFTFHACRSIHWEEFLKLRCRNGFGSLSPLTGLFENFNLKMYDLVYILYVWTNSQMYISRWIYLSWVDTILKIGRFQNWGVRIPNCSLTPQFWTAFNMGNVFLFSLKSWFFRDFSFNYTPDWTKWSSKFTKFSGEGLPRPLPTLSQALPLIRVLPSNLERFASSIRV